MDINFSTELDDVSEYYELLGVPGVVGTGVVHDGALRFPDECVRHKAIDLIGDLALLGALPRAFVTAHKAGHRLHHALVREIEARRSAQPAQPAQPA